MAGTNNHLYDQTYGNSYPDNDIYHAEEGVALYRTSVLLWHERSFGSYPDNTWFQARRPFYVPFSWYESYRPDLISDDPALLAIGYVPSEPIVINGMQFAEDNTEWCPGIYSWYKIPATSWYERPQLAVVSPVDRLQSTVEYYIFPDHTESHYHVEFYWGVKEIKANTVYVLCAVGDTPRWGSGSEFVYVGQSCSNTHQNIFEQQAVVRTQSFSVTAAAQADRAQLLSSVAVAALTRDEGFDTDAAVQGDVEKVLSSAAAVQGDAERLLRTRTSVASDVSLQLDIDGALATSFESELGAVAAVQGDADAEFETEAAVLGDAELSFLTAAYVAVDRTEAIMLEMENCWPQIFGNESVPNWPSRARHWGREPLA